MRRLPIFSLLVAVALSVAGAPVAGQSASDFIKEGEFTNQLLVALESGNKAEAQRLMTGDTAQKAYDVIKDLPDPKSKAARTAYDVRKDMAERVMKETARKVAADPKLKGRLISIELGGTAGKEGVGFTPGTADLDFQLRGTDAEASQAAAEIARKVMADLGVPVTSTGDNLFKINPFAANLDEAPVVRDTADRSGLNKNQADRIEQGKARHANPEASKGDAIDAVREDYYRRGVAYEIDPETGELRANPVTGELRTTPVDELYDKRGWPPPKVTEASAFGVVTNERELFTTLRDKSDAKRVFRAADAIALADPAALTPDERAAVELARRIYQTRDLEKAVQSLPKSHQARATYDRMLKDGQPRDVALNAALQQQDELVKNIFNKGMVTTLDAKLADIERTKAMSDAALLAEHNRRVRQGDQNARAWLDQYSAASVEQKTDMLKVARENLMEQKRLGLLDSFRFLPAETRARLVNDPRFAGNSLVTNASALAEVMNNAHDAMVRARQALNSVLDQALPPAAKKTGLEPSAEYHPGYAGGGLIRAGDRLLIAVALSGALDDIVAETMKAYDKGGHLAAAQMFVQRTAATASDVAVGMVYQYLVETVGLAAEARGLLWRGVTAGANAAMTIAALVEVSKVVSNVIWRSAQDPFLRSQLDPAANVSFYQTMQARPLTLWADAQRYSQRNRGALRSRGVDPNDPKAVLREMIRDFVRDSGARAGNMKGFEDRLFEALDAQATQSREFLAGLRESGIESERAAVAKRVDAEAKARADAARAALKAKELRDEKRERQAAANEKAAREDAARQRAARAAEEAKKAGEPKAQPTDGGQNSVDRWQALQREKQAEDEALRRQQAEVARQREAERRRIAEEERRNAEETRRLEEELLRQQEEEALLLEAATIDINVPATMQPGTQAAISVAVKAPGLRLSGRRVAIRATPGHTDDGSIPLDAIGRGRTNYVAPPDYNGYVRVTVSIEGGMQVSRTFLVGKPLAEAPPEKKIENPKEVTLPETKDPPPPPPPPAAAAGPCAMHTLAKLKEYVSGYRSAVEAQKRGSGQVSLDVLLGPAAFEQSIGAQCMAGCAAIKASAAPSDAALQACISGK